MTDNARTVLRHIAGDAPETFSELHANLFMLRLKELCDAIAELIQAGLIEKRYCATDAGLHAAALPPDVPADVPVSVDTSLHTKAASGHSVRGCEEDA